MRIVENLQFFEKAVFAFWVSTLSLGQTWVQAKGEEFDFTLRMDDPDNAVSVIEQVHCV